MKNRIINLLKNPIGVALAAFHWLIALPALAYIPVDNFGQITESSERAIIIVAILFIWDIPAIAVVALIFSPFYLLSFNVFFVLVFFGSFISITLQWLLVGRVIYNFFWRTEPEIEILGITGNTLANNLDSSNKTELK